MLASVEAILLHFIYTEFDYFDAKFLVLIIGDNLEIIMQWHMTVHYFYRQKFSGFRENGGVDY